MSKENTAAAPDRGGKRPLNIKTLRRRVARIENMTDAKQARKSRQRLLVSVLTAIAAGGVKNPARLASEALAAKAVKPSRDADADIE